jgi:acetyl-CoA C-acetyltransferase
MLQDGSGTVTAGNSSTYGDAAAAVVLMGGDVVKTRGVSPIARVVAFSQVGVDPAYMGIGPVPAVNSVVSLSIQSLMCDTMLLVILRLRKHT